ncbi:MAG: hypothetical protein OXL68_21970 [Paracoccaceae bacterium]|nr:hypothetical protein [Paracoccaceae bacterium]
MSAQFDGPGQYRRRDSVIKDDPGPEVTDNTNGGRQIDEFERGIGRRFEKHHPCLSGPKRAPLAERGVVEIASIAKPAEMTHLIDHAASSASQLLNMSKLGSRLHVDGKTVASGSHCSNTCSRSDKLAPGIAAG